MEMRRCQSVQTWVPVPFIGSKRYCTHQAHCLVVHEPIFAGLCLATEVCHVHFDWSSLLKTTIDSIVLENPPSIDYFLRKAVGFPYLCWRVAKRHHLSFKHRVISPCIACCLNIIYIYEHIESARTYLYNVGPYGQVGLAYISKNLWIHCR